MSFDAPLIHGSWYTPDAPTAHWLVARWSQAQGRTPNFFLDHAVPALRVLDCGCYPSTLLAEALIKDDRGRTGYANALAGPYGLVPLLGLSATLHALNAKVPLRLTEAATVRTYLLLFTSAIWGEAGRFQIIERADELLLSAGGEIDPAAMAYATEHIVRVEPRAEGDAWRAEAMIAYKGSLFAAHFRIQSTGEVEMIDDTPLADADAIHLAIETHHHGVRWQMLATG